MIQTQQICRGTAVGGTANAKGQYQLTQHDDQAALHVPIALVCNGEDCRARLVLSVPTTKPSPRRFQHRPVKKPSPHGAVWRQLCSGLQMHNMISERDSRPCLAPIPICHCIRMTRNYSATIHLCVRICDESDNRNLRRCPGIFRQLAPITGGEGRRSFRNRSQGSSIRVLSPRLDETNCPSTKRSKGLFISRPDLRCPGRTNRLF